MKLKQITKLLFVVLSVVTLASCNDNSTTYVTEDASANAQIYSLKLSATLANVSSIDSVNFPILATTRFSIDQFQRLIYNSDSLPYKTRLTKYMATLTYENPSKIEILYPNDSVVTWSTTDSIDFSLRPRIKVTPANGDAADAWTYTIDIRIHKVDPDSLVWTNVTSSFELPSTIKQQRTLLVGSVFHAFSIDNDNKFYSYTINKTSTSPLSWKREATSVIPASVKLESITSFNGKFYAVDADEKAYSSTDGVVWQVSNSNVLNILGVLPGKEAAKDSLLVVTKQLGKYVFAKTSNMQSLQVVENISYDKDSNEVPAGFPATGFTSVTNYDRSNLNRNILIVTAAQASYNLTWSVRQGDGRLEVESNQKNTLFDPSDGLRTFLYDGYVYALTKNLLYKTSSFGSKWIAASAKEKFIPGMSSSKQSIIVDSDNYIWIFGGIDTSIEALGSPVRQVWKGRINHLAR
ncbi:MAG: DUF6242 domain-containing protein [Prevotella sp.]|jgi:hypothetical protein|nr:DUF6242 domain-containing protein [Prevotella sp.]